MKTKVLFFAMSCFIGFAGYSQMGKPSVGLRAGINFQNLNGKNANGDNLSYNLKTGFHIGVLAEVPVASEFYIQPGVLFSTKGARDNNSISGQDVKVNLSYIEIPVNFLYKPVLGKGRTLIGFGPYIGYAVGGKVKVGSVDTDIKFANSISPSQESDPYYKRFDAGANFIFGYEMNSRISAQLNAQLGLAKINPKVTGTNNKESVKNTGFGVSVGYRL
jgi:hypothetical protein